MKESYVRSVDRVVVVAVCTLLFHGEVSWQLAPSPHRVMLKIRIVIIIFHSKDWLSVF